MPTYTVSDPLSLLFLYLADRIKATVTGIELVTKDFSQLETREQPNLPPNTVLVSFQNFTANEEGELQQIMTGEVIVKSIYPVYTLLTADTPDDARPAALKYFERAQAVFTALQGWAPGAGTEAHEIFSPFIRVGFTEDLRRPGLGVMVARYRVSYDDNTAKRSKHKTAVSPQFVVELAH